MKKSKKEFAKKCLIAFMISTLPVSGFVGLPTNVEAAMLSGKIVGVDGKSYHVALLDSYSNFVVYRNDVEILRQYSGGTPTNYPDIQSVSFEGDTLMISGKWTVGGASQNFAIDNVSKVKDKIVTSTQSGQTTFTFPKDSTQKQVKTGRKGSWLSVGSSEYSKSINSTLANQVLYARAISSSGELLEASYTVPLPSQTANILDIEGPDGLQYNVSKFLVGGSVYIRATRPDGTNVQAVLSGSGTLVDGFRSLKWNGNNLEATISWSPGPVNQTGTLYNVVSGDFSNPVITLSRDENSPIVNATITDNVGVVSKKWASGVQYETYFVNGGTKLEGDSFEVSGVGKYTVYAKDAAGNESLQVIDVNSLVQPPNPATFTVDKTNPSKSVTVTISYPTDTVKNEYRIGTNGSWEAYTEPVILTSNETVFAHSQSSAGDWSQESSVTVSNIDNEAPELYLGLGSSSPTKTSVIIFTAVEVEAQSELKWAYGEHPISYFQGGTVGNKVSFNQFSATENGIYTVYTKDEAGNEVVSHITVNLIDRIVPTSPTATVVDNLLTITAGTDASGISKTQYQLNNGSWVVYSSPVTLADGSYIINVKSIDRAGNESLLTKIEATVGSFNWDAINNAIEAAESSPSQAKVDDARDLLESAPVSSEKDAFETRLDKVQNDINLYASIQNEISTINNSVDSGKASLTDIQNFKVKVNELRNEVETLPNTMDKANLQKQLDDLYAKLILIETVLKTNGNSDTEEVDLGDLEDQINDLPDGDLKDQLQNELDQAKALQDAISKVERAESSNSQGDVDTARDAVNNLPNGKTKDELNNRLDLVQEKINSGGNDENGDGQPLIDINDIRDPVVKATLLDAERYVQLAEKYNSKTWIVSALGKVEAIPTSVKSNPMYTAIVQDLTNRVNKLKVDYNSGIADQEAQQKVTVATNYVAMYEKYKTSYYKTKAQTSVDALSDGDVKTSLQQRINDVK